MPTWAATDRFYKDFATLTAGEKAAFRLAVSKLVEDFNAGRPARAGLRVKGVQGAPGIFEFTWAGDGRATFQFGEERHAGNPHVIWRRIGGHDIFNAP